MVALRAIWREGSLVTALQWVGAWFGVSVPVSLLVGAVLHAGGSAPGGAQQLQPAPAARARRAA